MKVEYEYHFECNECIYGKILRPRGMMKPGANDPTTPVGKVNAMLKEKIDRGETGINAGKGFYDYTK